MKKRVLWSFLCLLIIFFSGCGSNNRTVKYATLCGWIIDAADERPISGAKVNIDDQEKASTNSEGYFKTGRFQTGERRLSFTAEGYNPLSGKQNFREEGDFWLIVDEENFKPGCIPLSPIMEGTISPTSVYDLGVVNGSGEVKILANGKVDSLLLIPYNTSMTMGNYSASIELKTDNGISGKYLLDSLQREKRMITSAMSAESEKEAFYQRLRETEEEALRAQLGRGVFPGPGDRKSVV